MRYVGKEHLRGRCGRPRRTPRGGGAARPGSYSNSSEGDSCVEVSTAPGVVRVRDAKNLAGPRIAFGAAAWTGFVAHTPPSFC
ncbi:DUF397 domain-containing protein [Streptomyces sp. NPDC020780]|uniref:DUF397 domain-containing protein n=1 Tax=unclassified Streptomyces TaxID=2593676 RepID=UPI0037B98AF8